MQGRAMGRCVATIYAYELKVGGFRGIYIAKTEGGEYLKSEILKTLEDARYWAKSQAFERYGKEPGFNIASYRGKYAYNANVWIG
jgi:hypothetical protein